MSGPMRGVGQKTKSMSHESEIATHYRDLKKHMATIKRDLGIDCPGCKIKQPKRIPTRLIPGKTCKVCGTNYRKAKANP